MGLAAALFVSMRPRQWVKNLLIYAALFFNPKIISLNSILEVSAGFLVFSLLSSGVYLFNDVLDVERDKLHPIKSKRPIASGDLPSRTALILSAVLVALSLAGAYLLTQNFLFISAAYIVLNLAYSTRLKHMVIIDAFSIAAGFVLRVYGGAQIIQEITSPWIVLCTVLLALFLTFSKRRHELTLFGDDALEHRETLAQYDITFLDQMIAVVTASTVIAYALWAMSPETVEKFGTGNLVYTVPFVCYGIFRYLYIVYKQGEGGDPTTIFLTDLPLIINIILWAASVVLVIYI